MLFVWTSGWYGQNRNLWSLSTDEYSRHSAWGGRSLAWGQGESACFSGQSRPPGWSSWE